MVKNSFLQIFPKSTFNTLTLYKNENVNLKLYMFQLIYLELTNKKIYLYSYISKRHTSWFFRIMQISSNIAHFGGIRHEFKVLNIIFTSLEIKHNACL